MAYLPEWSFVSKDIPGGVGLEIRYGHALWRTYGWASTVAVHKKRAREFYPWGREMVLEDL